MRLTICMCLDLQVHSREWCNVQQSITTVHQSQRLYTVVVVLAAVSSVSISWAMLVTLLHVTPLLRAAFGPKIAVKKPHL